MSRDDVIQDALGTARLTHRLLVGICAATLLFAIAPDPRVEMRGAIAELAQLHEALNDDGYSAHLRAELSRLPAEIDRAELFEKLCATIEDAGFRHDAMDFETDLDSGDLPEPPHSNQALTEIVAGIDRSRKVDIHELDLDATLAEAGRILQEFKKSPEGDGLDLVLQVDIVYHSVLRRDPEEPLERPQRLDFAVQTKLGADPTYNGDFDRTWATGELRLQGHAYPSYEEHLKTWWPQLWSSVDGNDEIFLRSTRRYWQGIRDLKVGDALRSLESRLVEEERALPLLGLSVPADLVALAAPLAILGLLLFLLAHISHLSTLRRHHAPTFAIFPWLVLFDGRWRRLLALVAHGLLPIVACGLLLLRIGESLPAGLRGLLALSVCSAAGLLGWRINSLNRAIHCVETTSAPKPVAIQEQASDNAETQALLTTSAFVGRDATLTAANANFAWSEDSKTYHHARCRMVKTIKRPSFSDEAPAGRYLHRGCPHEDATEMESTESSG